MNLKIVNGENEQPYLSHNSNSNVATLNHSKSHIVDQPLVHNASKTPTNQSNSIRGLQNPRIMDQKFSMASSKVRDSENQNISNQASQRFLNDGTDSQKKNLITRKTSHNNTSSVSQSGVFRGMRSGTNHGMTSSTSATGTSRYSQGNFNQNAHQRIEQQIKKNVQYDKRLNELKQQNSHSSQIMMNKYADRQANDSNRVINSKINKSGQNITANFTRVLKKGVPQTQRTGTSERTTIGRNTQKNSVNVTQSGINATNTMMSTHSALQKMSTTSSNKVTTTLIKTNNGDQMDKENHQKLSNRQGAQSSIDSSSLNLKRNKTSDGINRQSIVHSRQSNPSGHQKSKKSDEEEEKMSVGTSNRNNSQHHTNRSALVSAVSSKQAGRMSIAYQGSSDFTTKNLSMS